MQIIHRRQTRRPTRQQFQCPQRLNRFDPAYRLRTVVIHLHSADLIPFILQILPHGLSLPQVPKGDQVWQHSEAVQQRVDAEGNWLRVTDATITDRASERRVQALENVERYQVSSVEVDDHSMESVLPRALT